MNKYSTKLILCLIAAMCILAPLSATAQDAPPPLAEVWLVTPKAGQVGAFHAALKEHVDVRVAHGDSRTWQVFSSYAGDTLNQYAIRFCCTSWADQDAYEKWGADNPEVLEHWMSTVGPYVEKIQHYFNHIDWANSHWSSDGGPYRYITVDEWTLKGGHEADFTAAKTKMSQIAINQGWSAGGHNWAWFTQIGGKSKVALAVPHKNFASMESGEESFGEFLGKHLGSPEAAGELMQKFSASTWGSETTIWQHHAELSISGDE